jgi:cobalt-zinc-cadmium efflux system membrane fusion protein
MRAVLAMSLAASLAACSTAPAEQAADAKAASAASPAGYFTVPAAQLSHLQIVPVVQATWTTTLHTTGTVDWDQDHTTQAITQVGGPITRIVVDWGAQVKAGDPLLYVSSPDVTNAISAYRKAKNRLALAQKTLDRMRDLVAHKANAARDLESAEADFNDAATDVQTSLQPLKIFGVTQADLDDAEKQDMPIRPELPMRAPIDGVVVQKLVLPGQLITAGTTLAFVISDVSTVWVQGHINEKDLTSVRIGDEVDLRNASIPTVFHGIVAYIDHLVDPATRTTLMRIVTKNTGGLLKKDLFMDVDLRDRAQRAVLVVPVPAVLYDEQNFPFVYVQVAVGKFAERLVTLGRQQGDLIDVATGLKAGDLVVSQGSIFLQFANTFGK